MVCYSRKKMIEKLTTAWKEFEEKGFADLEDGCFLERGRDIFARIEGEEDELWETREEYDNDSIYLTTDNGEVPQEIGNLEDLIELYDDMYMSAGLYDEDEEEEQED